MAGLGMARTVARTLPLLWAFCQAAEDSCEVDASALLQQPPHLRHFFHRLYKPRIYGYGYPHGYGHTETAPTTTAVAEDADTIATPAPVIDPTAAKVADNNAVNDEANTIATTSIAPQTNAVNDEADTIATTTVTAEDGPNVSADGATTTMDESTTFANETTAVTEEPRSTTEQPDTVMENASTATTSAATADEAASVTDDSSTTSAEVAEENGSTTMTDDLQASTDEPSTSLDEIHEDASEEEAGTTSWAAMHPHGDLRDSTTATTTADTVTTDAIGGSSTSTFDVTTTEEEFQWEETCAGKAETCDDDNCCDDFECMHTANETFICARCVPMAGGLCARCEFNYCNHEVECCYGMTCGGSFDPSNASSFGFCEFE